MIHMGGIHESGSLLTIGGYYMTDYKLSDFSLGILSEENPPQVIMGSELFYDKIWNIYDFEIHLMISLFESGNLTLDDLSNDIITWPGKGNPHVNSDFVSTHVAPFHDHDSNGVYNPLLGDYPIVSTSEGDFIPSQFTFSTYHDLGIHYNTHSQPLMIQLYQMQYVIDCNIGDLNRTVFTQIKFKSHNPEKISKSYFGLFVDNDLGCGQDDRFGYDEETNSVYTYNSNGYDEQDCFLDALSADNTYTVVNSMIFESQLSSLSQTYNSPYNPDYYYDYNTYNRLRGFWRDGTALTYGGTGFNPASKDTVQFLFPDFPNDPDGWSLESINATFEDRRYIPSIYIGDITPGSIHQFEYSELMMLNGTADGLDIFNSYRSKIETMKIAKKQYINGVIECPVVKLCQDDCVWPGDTNADGIVNNDDFIYLAAAKNTPLARPRENIDRLWHPHHANNWGTNSSMIDFKHSDTDGIVSSMIMILIT